MERKRMVIFVLVMILCTVAIPAAFAAEAQQIPQSQPAAELLKALDKQRALLREYKELKKEQVASMQEQKKLMMLQANERARAIKDQKELAAQQATERTLEMREKEKLAAATARAAREQAKTAGNIKTIMMIAAGVILFCAIGLIAIVVIISRRKNGVTAAKTTKETEDEQGSSVLLDPTSDQLKKIALETGAMEIRFDLPLEEGTFECVAIMIMTGAETMVRSISVRFLKDPDQNVVGWDTRRHYAGKHLDFAK